MGPNHIAIPTWHPPRKTRTVRRWRPSDQQLQILWKIYDEETDTPSEERREQIKATLEKLGPLASQNLIVTVKERRTILKITVKARQTAPVATTNRDVKSWFQNRKREESERNSIQPSLSIAESSADGELVTSWRPNENQLRVLWYVYDQGNGTPSVARRKAIIEALIQEGPPVTDSQKEITGTLTEHRPATIQVSDRNVKAWFDNRYRDKRFRKKGIPQRMVSREISSEDAEPDFSPRNQNSGSASLQGTASEVLMLDKRLQILNLLYYDQSFAAKGRVEEITAVFKNRYGPIAETNAILRGLLVTEEQLEARLPSLTKMYDDEPIGTPDKALLKKIVATMKMNLPIHEINVKLHGLIATEDFGISDGSQVVSGEGALASSGVSPSDDGEADFFPSI